MYRKEITKALCAAGILIAMTTAAYAEDVTVLAGENVFTIAKTLDDPTDLWVSPEDMTLINGFELKPEGACYEEICMPINQNENSRIFVKRTGARWINITEMARRLQQAYTVDADSNVWSFGEVPMKRTPFLESAIAPDFELTDRNGDTVRLSDYKGKKVLIITWASW